LSLLAQPPAFWSSKAGRLVGPRKVLVVFGGFGVNASDSDYFYYESGDYHFTVRARYFLLRGFFHDCQCVAFGFVYKRIGGFSKRAWMILVLLIRNTRATKQGLVRAI
jgi:hypothetical protein